MNFKKSKKGISPLIASVILIAFVIAIGSITYTFFAGFSESTKAGIEEKKSGSISCTMAALKIDKDSISYPGYFYYQENGTSIQIADNYFYVNYTKHFNSMDGTIWIVKHGNLSEYNITLPSDCWNADTNKLILRMYSLISSSVSSYPQCYNGSDWITIGNTISFTPTFIGFSDEGNETLYDENWNTYAAYRGDSFNKWYTDIQADGIYARIYEEGIFWKIKNISLDIENIGQTDLSGLKIIAYNETGAYTYDASPSSIFEGSKLTISSEHPGGTITKIKVVSTDCPGVESVVEKENGEWKLKR